MFIPTDKDSDSILDAQSKLASALGQHLDIRQFFEAQSPDGRVRLNLGAGNEPVPGFDNSWDIKNGRAIYPLDAPDGYADEIRASHCLEHLNAKEGVLALRDWVRVLKPGGLLKIAVPDFESIAFGYLNGIPQHTAAYTMGGQIDENDFHKQIFDREHLEAMMRDAGLDGIHLWTSEVKDCAALPISLNLAGWKRQRMPKIEAVMSMPRLSFTDNTFSMIALPGVGIKPRKTTGAFWGQCLERGITDALAEVKDCEYILTVDYDSVFLPRDLFDLVAIARAHPEFDAIAPFQQHRSAGHPLMVIRDGEGKMVTSYGPDFFDQTVIPVETAHFGCTLIRSSVFAKLKHPWFWSTPAPDGSWGEGRIDDDLYFWRSFKEHGLKLAITPRVTIGHCELMVMWPGEDLKTMYQRPNDFWSEGKPVKAWR